MKLTYAVVYENGPNNLSAYVPDLPGCVSVGNTLEEIRENMREAMTFHVDLMLQNDEPVPEPKTSMDQAFSQHNDSLTEIYDDLGGNVPEPPAIVELVDVYTLPEAVLRDYAHPAPKAQTAIGQRVNGSISVEP